jgi:hypothetical protein
MGRNMQHMAMVYSGESFVGQRSQEARAHRRSIARIALQARHNRCKRRAVSKYGLRGVAS